MWIPTLLICFLLVSGELWAERDVRGVVGRAITIDCHYAAKYRSHTKYWCRGWSHFCSVLVETNGQHGRRGRVSITDNPARGIFTVTVEDLHSGDTGRYSCGITKRSFDPMFNIHLQVSDEPVSIPVLGFLSPANASCTGGSVSVSCESVQGSLPIQYTWYERTPSVDSKISGTSKLDLHCQSFKHRHHQYYCTASNVNGTKSSEMVNVTVFSGTGTCSYVTEINSNRSGYFCETSATESTIRTHSANTEIRPNDSQGPIYIIVPSLIGILVVAFLICLLWFLRCKRREFKFKIFHRGSNNETQLHDMESGAALRSAEELEYLSHMVHEKNQEILTTDATASHPSPDSPWARGGSSAGPLVVDEVCRCERSLFS
ncbi:high affinity immunoglobulin alpha and immunoglobulin mu Fc receptor-like [Pristis pectinata]|uniref:high affinity immunoglobulin alpha and immunoglobulin mu Fc receptor-like n=1 Tax=Pristis pectinata TaxID=685728 RepID=UPI00223D88AA|nr:high affinity immunoglobulin alpha and immunoglobulin mu Fc receptor-like [Pristis pectinata]